MSLGPTWVVILAWNEYRFTRECLTSVLALDPGPDRVLLVDNGSTDRTAEKVQAEFPEVEVLRLDRNRYFAGGVNEGFRRAMDQGARSILLLNNDVVLERSALETMSEALRADPNRAAVSPRIYYYDRPDVIWFAGGIVGGGFGLIRHRGVNRKEEKLRDSPREVGYVSGAAALFSREGLESVGLLDPSYVIYVEDVDWSARAREKGFKLWYTPEAKVWHHVSATTGGGLTPLKAYFRLRSGALYLARHARAGERALAFGAYFCWTAWLLARAVANGEIRSAAALIAGFADFTRILLGGTPPYRAPESFGKVAWPKRGGPPHLTP